MGIMPWKTVDLMDQKLRFVHLAKNGRRRQRSVNPQFFSSLRPSRSLRESFPNSSHPLSLCAPVPFSFLIPN